MKRLVFTILSLCAAVPFRGALAAPVDANQARKAAQAWINRGYSLDRLSGRTVDSVETLSSGAATMHLAKIAGGGYVVLSADDTIDPVIAFSDTGGTLEQDDGNPLWVLVKADLAARAAAGAASDGGGTSARSLASVQTPAQRRWSELLGSGRAVMSAPSVADIRVAPFLDTAWDQRMVGTNNVFNYYTPNNYHCGCVATATGQIMRYHEWPTTSVSALTSTCKVDGVSKTFKMKGGVYDWANMPKVPTSGITLTQQKAIGKLTYDIGCSVGMNWTSNGSSASIYRARLRLKDTFGFKSCEGVAFTTNYVYSLARCKRIVIPCLEYGSLVEMGLSGSGGHAVVIDGYGYSDGDFYMHVNCGWGGSNNAWYCPSDLTMGPYVYSAISGFIFSILPQKTGIIISGRVLSAGGAPIAHATVVLKDSTTVKATAVTDEKGIYAVLAPKAAAYTLTATAGAVSETISVTVNANNSKQMATNGGYYTQKGYEPTLGNVYGKDIQLPEIVCVEDPVLSPASCSFYPSTNVTLTCATEGAVVRYTTDGSDPTEESEIYTGPITVTDDTIVKARAYKSGLYPSAFVSGSYAYDIVRGGPRGDFYNRPIEISGASGGHVISDNSSYTLESGEAEHTFGTTYYSTQYRTSWYRWTAPGSGRMTFMTSCSNKGTLMPTAVAVYADADTVPTQNGSWLAASSDFQSAGAFTTAVSLQVTQGTTYRIVGVPTFNTGGLFTLSWSGELVVSEQTSTEGTEVSVPFAWLKRYYGSQTVAEYERIGNSSGANGCAVWESYLLDLDPTNANSRLEVSLRMEDGRPVIGWNVTSTNAVALGYSYRVKGRSSLAEGAWECPTNSSHRFFKVFLEK